jgi:hypothetical protein
MRAPAGVKHLGRQFSGEPTATAEPRNVKCHRLPRSHNRTPSQFRRPPKKLGSSPSASSSSANGLPPDRCQPSVSLALHIACGRESLHAPWSKSLMKLFLTCCWLFHQARETRTCPNIVILAAAPKEDCFAAPLTASHVSAFELGPMFQRPCLPTLVPLPFLSQDKGETPKDASRVQVGYITRGSHASSRRFLVLHPINQPTSSQLPILCFFPLSFLRKASILRTGSTPLND